VKFPNSADRLWDFLQRFVQLPHRTIQSRSYSINGTQSGKFPRG